MMITWRGALPLWIPLLSLIFFAPGCGPTPAPLLEQRKVNAEADRKLFDQMETVVPPTLTPGMAVDLAMRQNLKIWLASQEAAIQREMRGGALLKMMPELTLRGSRQGRDRLSASNSIGLFSGEDAQNATYSYSQPRIHQTGGVSLLWNVMDFGVSYLRYRQEEQRVAMREQDLRRARQTLAFEVIQAYWEVLTQRDVAAKAIALEAALDGELSNIEELVEKKQLAESAAILRRYPIKKQRRRISTYKEAYRRSRTQLSQLLGIPVGKDFDLTLAIPETLPGFRTNIAKLEEMAILNRPELYKQDMSQTISRDEARVALLKMLPSPGMLIGKERDDNPQLYFDHWARFSVDVTWDLLSIPSKVRQARSHRRREAFEGRKRMALAVAILTQLHLAIIEHQFAMVQYSLSRDIVKDSDTVVAMMEQSAKEGTGRNRLVLAQKVQQLEEFAVTMKAYSRVMAARARVVTTVGFDLDQYGDRLWSRLWGSPEAVKVAEEESKPEDSELTDTRETDDAVEACPVVDPDFSVATEVAQQQILSTSLFLW